MLIGYSKEREEELRQYWDNEIRDQRKWTRGMNLFWGSHGDRDGGSKCVTTGLICVPNKKSESSRKELSGFFVSLLECSRVGKRTCYGNGCK